MTTWVSSNRSSLIVATLFHGPCITFFCRAIINYTMVSCWQTIILVVTLLAKDVMGGGTQPHIIYILVDDLGFSDLGYTVATNISTPPPFTPTIDRLQSNPSTRTLRNYYVEPVCSPSRSSIQTGLYPLHHGVVNWLKPENANGLPLNLTTLAESMNGLGYVSRGERGRERFDPGSRTGVVLGAVTNTYWSLRYSSRHQF